MVGEIWKSISRVGNSLLNMTSFLRVELGYPPLYHWPSWVLAIHFFLASDLCYVAMTTDPMDPKSAKLLVVLSICWRVVLLQLHLPLILCIIQNHFASLCLMSMMWDTLCPSFDTVSSCRLQLIIREVDPETPFQYLRACMPWWQVLHTQWQVHVIGFRLSDFTGVRLQFLYSHSVNFSNSIGLRTIVIISGFSRAC